VLYGIGNSRKGFVTIALSIGMVFLLGVVGLSIDIGRMYVTKNEAQAFADSAALDAARLLDGTAKGLNLAAAKAAANSNTWQFGTTRFNAPAVTFSPALDGVYSPAASAPAASAFVRVHVAANVPLFFLPIVVQSTQSTVAASAVAGWAKSTLPVTMGLGPFTPYSHKGCGAGCDKGGDPFGFTVGAEYTMVRGSNKNKLSSLCSGDNFDSILENMVQQAPSDFRGYLDYGSASGLKTEILDGGPYAQPVSLDPTSPDNSLANRLVSGEKNSVMAALTERVTKQDTDNESTDFTGYLSNIQAAREGQPVSKAGNGRRLMAVPVNSGPPAFKVTGYAMFFLNDLDYKKNGNAPACAQYIGPWTQGGLPGATLDNDGSKYILRLYE
jgi:Flp pilus assembly protein TadG